MNLGRKSETIEFKKTTGERHEAIESIVSMINKHGYGELYFGVNDDGGVEGQIINDSTIKDLSESISRDIEPRIVPTINVIKNGEKEILKVSFSGTQVPYSAYGKFLIRVGTQNRKLSRDELIILIKKHDYALKWEEEIHHDIGDIDNDSLKKYFDEAVQCGRLAMVQYDEEAALSAIGVLKNGNKVNNAGYALFGKGEPVSLKLACYATDEKLTFIDLKEIKGNIYHLINEAMKYIGSNIHWSVTYGTRKRIETPEIPLFAIREMVINAFAHANYMSDSEIEINIHPGKITIFNPGSFPEWLTPNDFIDKNTPSIKRNPLILDALFRCKDVEKSGSGFRRMNELCEEAHIKWDYKNFGYGFGFEFLRNNENINAKLPQIENDLSDNELTIYMKIKEDRKIGYDELSILINKGKKTAQRISLSLIRKGYIRRIGNNQYGYWEVLK